MRLDSAVATQADVATKEGSPLSFFEFWPGWLFYTPIVLQWIALGLRHGDMSLPTAANPHITTGGLCGESKLSILSQVGSGGADLIPPACGVVARPNGAAAAEAAMAGAGLTYPVVVKPDIGCNGTGVRLLQGRADLERYLDSFPVNEIMVLQEFVTEPNEAGIFYVREPGADSGRITSLTIKRAPVVVGDGHSTLRALIMADERASKVAHLYLDRLAARLDSVPLAGDVVQLVFVGNHCKGSIFENGANLITPALTQAVERLVRTMPEFHFGRIDIRYASTAALRQGTGFRIIEINGVGSEPTHIWDPRTKLMEAWRVWFSHCAAAFRIGAANRRRGFKTSGVMQMLHDWRNQRRLLASYPLND